MHRKRRGRLVCIFSVISVLGFFIVPQVMRANSPYITQENSFNPPPQNAESNGNTAGGKHALGKNTTGISNTALGTRALASNVGGRFLSLPLGSYNTASGAHALYNNTIGVRNTASGYEALKSNTTGSRNTAIGYGADVSSGDFANATAIGSGAMADASNKIRLGNTDVAVIEGQVAFTYGADRTTQEKIQPVKGTEVLQKIRRMPIASWNFKGQDSTRLRHYGPTAQDFYAAFGHDGTGTIGTETTINSGDIAGILMIAVQALEQRTQEIERLNADLARIQSDDAEKIQRLTTEIAQLKRVMNP